MDGVGRRFDVEQPGQLTDGPLVEQRMRDVVPGDLGEVRLGQVDPERLVIRRLLAQQRVAVVVDDRDRREVEGHPRPPGSVLEEVLFDLPGVVVLGVRGSLGTSDLEVFDGQWLAQGGDQDRVGLERVEGCRRRLREATDAAARRAPRQLRLPGSWSTGWPGSRPRSIPSRAAAITPPSEMYGFALASLALSSRFAEPASSSQ